MGLLVHVVDVVGQHSHALPALLAELLLEGPEELVEELDVLQAEAHAVMVVLAPRLFLEDRLQRQVLDLRDVDELHVEHLDLVPLLVVELVEGDQDLLVEGRGVKLEELVQHDAHELDVG